MPQTRRPAADQSHDQAPPTWMEDALNAAAILLVCAVVGGAAFRVNATYSAERPTDGAALARKWHEEQKAAASKPVPAIALGALPSKLK